VRASRRRWSRNENCKLQTANCKLQTANCKLQTANCKLPSPALRARRDIGGDASASIAACSRHVEF
jgi:hypothetical protein